MYILAPSGPPLNIKTASRSPTSLYFIWNPPKKTQQNGVILSYTACISHLENGPCFWALTTIERTWFVTRLNHSTKYYFRACASTKIGSGNYSKSEEFITNGSK